MGLIISAPITQNAGNTNAISKTGTGSLVLNNVNSNWTTGLALNGGTLIIGGGNSTPTTASTVLSPTTVTAGPIGTGTVTIANGTTIQADTAARTIANPIAFTGAGATGFTAGGTAATS